MYSNRAGHATRPMLKVKCQALCVTSFTDSSRRDLNLSEFLLICTLCPEAHESLGDRMYLILSRVVWWLRSLKMFILRLLFVQIDVVVIKVSPRMKKAYKGPHFPAVFFWCDLFCIDIDTATPPVQSCVDNFQLYELPVSHISTGNQLIFF